MQVAGVLLALGADGHELGQILSAVAGREHAALVRLAEDAFGPTLWKQFVQRGS